MGVDNTKLDRPINVGERGLINSITTPRPGGSYGPGYGAEPPDGVHLRDLWRVVRKRKWLIVSLSLIAMLVVTVEVHRTPSIYRAETIIELAEESPTLLRNSEPAVESDPTRAIKAKKVIFKSRPVLEDIVEAVQLDQTPNFVTSLRKRSIPEAVRDLAYRLVGTFREPPSSGPAVLPPLPTERDRERTAEESQRLAPYVEVLKEKLTVDSIDETNILRLTFDHTDPVLAARVVNTAARSIIDRHFAAKVARYSDTSGWLQRSTRELKVKVEEAERALADYTQRNRIFATESKQSLTTEKLTSLHGQAMRSEIDRMLKQSLFEDVQRGRLEQVPEVFSDQKSNQLLAELGRLRVEEAELSVRYGPENPQLQQVQSKIRTLSSQVGEARSSLESRLRADYERAVRDERSLQQALERAKGEAVNENQASIQYHILIQEVETAKSLYNDFLQKTKQAELQLAEQYNNLRVVEPATIPDSPVGPQRLRTILIGLLVSLIGALGVAFFLEYLDNTVRSVDDIGRLVQLPTLAVIPSITTITPKALAERRRDGGDSEALTPLTEQDPEGTASTRLVTLDQLSTVVEAYRMLRTSLLLSTAGRTPKTMLFTSGQPGEGKTTTAINTAISLSQLGASVLLIDADLRRPTIHRVFRLNSPQGLSACLALDLNPDEVIRKTWVPNLSVLPCGQVPVNPSELISSDRMRQLLADLADQYDHVLIDSPPLINVTDPVILSTLVDGVVLVVHAGHSTREVVRRARHELASVGAQILGVVLNNLDVQREGYGAYPAYKTYGKSYGKGDIYSTGG
jgi:succinoglycan biosynthesis transport protein ExoP